MGFLDVLGGAGVVLKSAQDAEAERAKRAHDEAIRKMALEEGTIGIERLRESRDLERGASAIPAMTIPGQTSAPIYDEADGQTEIGRTPEVPGGQQPDYEARARYFLSRGRPDLWAKEKAAQKAVVNEGMVDLAKALISGQDAKVAVAEHYNTKGADRIDPASVNFIGGVLEGRRANGQPFRFDPKAFLIQAGVKQHNLLKVAPGEKVIDPATRETVAEGHPRPVTPRNRDPLSPEGIEAAVEREKRLAQIRAELRKKHGPEQATALERGVAYIARIKGIPEADAYDLYRTTTTKPEPDAVREIAMKLKERDINGTFEGPDGDSKLAAAAARLYRELAAVAPKKAPRAPAQAPTPGAFTSDTEVRDAYRAKRITREQAEAELRKLGYE